MYYIYSMKVVGWFKKELLLVGLLMISLCAYSQSGSYFMTHYNPAEENFDNANYAMHQDDRGVMHIANRQGVLHYDGNGWWLTPIPFSVYCIDEAEGKIFIGGREGFGYISSRGGESDKYFALDTVSRDVLKVLLRKDEGYYITENELFKFSTSQPHGIARLETNGLELLDLAKVDDRIFISTMDGLYEIDNEHQIHKADYAPEGAFFIRKSESGRVLYLTDSSTIYTQYEGKIERLNFANSNYLEDHTVTEILWANDSLISVSTLSGGILFIDVPSGETVQIVDYESGLPDNQISSLFVDRSGGLWASHLHGFSVISPSLPLRSFNYYPGLKGALISVLPYNDELYVGTSLGLYHLTVRKQMREFVVYDRVRVAVDAVEETPKEVVVPQKKEKRGLFRRKKKAIKDEEKVEEEQVEAAQAYKYVYQRRVVEEELSRSYEFRKVGGINSKCVQLLEYNNRLLAGTLQGVYEIDEDTAYLVNEVPVLYMYGLENQNLAFISTVDEEVRVLELWRDKWEETGMLEGLTDYIDQITKDPDGNVWLCGADSLYRIVLDKRDMIDVEVYEIENPHFDRIYSTNYLNQILFINSTGYFSYENLGINRQESIEEEIGLPRKFILGAQGQLLVNTGNNWYGAGNNLRTSLNFLSFFKDPIAIAKDDSYDYWVTTATNDLYKVNILELGRLSGEEVIYLKEVRSNDVKIPLAAQAFVEQEASQLTFEFASPDYTGIYSKEYRFRLRNAGGVTAPWSAWSANNNVISYQFLPPGSYTLEASFRNSLGSVVNAEPFKFKVVAPYWKRPWFYVLEVLFFSGLLLFSFYLNHGRGKYVVISRLLGFMTLILIVEFFQTVAEYYYESDNSPVINFFIQAFIALLILPVESVLRRYLTRTPEDNPKGKIA